MRGLALVLLLAGACRSSTPTGPCTIDCEARCADGDGASCAAAAEKAFDGHNGMPLDLARSFAYATKACELDDGRGCALLGLHYQDGRGAPWDHARAIATYEKACALGAGTGCYNLESMYSGGHGAVVDRAKADALHAKARAAWDAACHGAAPRWCTNLAFLVESDGEITQAKRESALVLDVRACDAGVLVGCSQAAREQIELGKLEPTVYLARLEELCGRGDPGACGQGGLDAFLGAHGLAKDEAHGRALLRRGCDFGDNLSCYQAALAGVQHEPQDVDAITRDFAAACDRGYGKGCAAIGKDLLRRGLVAQAQPFAERACQIGEKDGCAALADMYLAGNGVPRDSTKGLAWAREACSMGDGDMCFTLIAAGLDPPVPPDVVPKLRADACKAGVASACR